MKKLIFLFVLFSTSICQAATWYVDKDATGSHNGTSWANAWTSFESITGVNPGDTVYISGGTTSKTYSMASNYLPPSGTSGNPITFKVGQTSGYNGTVVIDGGNTYNSFIYMGSSNQLNYFTLDGEVNGSRHITLQNFASSLVIIYGGTGVTLRYINFQGDATVALPTSFTFEYNYSECYCECIEMGGGTPPDLALGTNKVRYNTFHMPYNPSGGDGANSWGIGWPGTGTDINDNLFNSYLKSGYTPNCHHSDAIFTDSSKMRVYNNTLRGFASNYGLYWELGSGSYHDIYVYNNVCEPGNYNCIVIGGSAATMSSVVVANNTCLGTNTCLDTVNATTTWDSSSNFYNNINYNGVLAMRISPNVSGYSSGTNKDVTDGNCATHFVSCSGTYDFHLLSGDTTFRDHGINTGLTTYFTTDKDGYTRPGTWDIGAYEYQGEPQGDTNPPVITTTGPSTQQACVAGESSATLTATTTDATNPVTCKYCENGVGGCSSSTSYDSMANTFSTTGGNNHSQSKTGLACNASLKYYVRCADAVGTPNKNPTSSEINFTTQATTDTTKPTWTSSTLGTDGRTLTLVFSEAVKRGAGYADSQVTVTPSGGAATLAYVSGDNSTTWTLTTSRVILSTENLTTSIAQPGTGITDLAGNPLDAVSDKTTTNNSTQSTVTGTARTIWPSDVTVGTVYAGSPCNLGVKFGSTVVGVITGVRFYKDVTDTGTHIINLYTLDGTLLATKTVSGETASGWQQQLFDAAVTISANTAYVAAYYNPTGNFTSTGDYFQTSGVSNPPLYALQTAVETGYNGAHLVVAQSSFPSSGSPTGRNYWVDVVFELTPGAVTGLVITGGIIH